MVSIEGKRKTLLLFFVLVWLPAVVFYMLEATGNVGDYIQTIFYVIITAVCLGILAFMKSDDQYYRNLNPMYLLLSVIVALVMTGLSWGLSLKFGAETLSLSLGYTLAFIAAPSSITTIFLSLMLFGLVMPATSEELMKLTTFAELKERFGNKWYGVFIYVGFPVGFWALLHAVSAYNNPILILPAFVNGIVLIVFLWYTKCLLAVIFSHFLYNSSVTLVAIINGTANIPAGTPLIPNFLALNIADICVSILVVAGFLFFLLPSLRRDKTE